jgi:hypothetical protein|tara:strand:- start:2176 stop:2463 length:288 start_codon:yes stop_codon:yes gene_type:complete
MNRGEVRIIANFVDHTRIDVNCFVNFKDPRDKEEIIDVVMGAFDAIVADNSYLHDTSLLSGFAEIEFFEGLLVYKVRFDDVMEKAEWDWSRETLH